MSANKIKITYDPYKKTVSYLIMNENGQWEEPAMESQLTSHRVCSSVTLQNILPELVEIFSGYGDVQLLFSGTQEDWEDLEHTMETRFSDKDITCTQDKEMSLISAREAMEQIHAIFNRIEIDLRKSKVDSSEVTEHLDQFEKIVTPEIAICIVGVYSSGKSTFINSLIGDEVLPSGDDPTTARIQCVRSTRPGDNISRLSFSYNEAKLSIKFDGPSIQLVAPGQITNKEASAFANTLIKKIKEECAVHSQTDHLRMAIEEINKCPTVHDLIEITVPFVRSSLPLDRYRFAFYDTPGSQSESNEAHEKVLHRALEQQTNGLPIILIKAPDDMDNVANKELVRALSSNGTADSSSRDQLASLLAGAKGTLDISNTMIVVNKSEEKDTSELGRAKNNNFFANSQLRRFFFVSAKFGLIGKQETYREKKRIDLKRYKESFTNPDDEGYIQLFSHNTVQPLSPKNTPNDEWERIVFNSGIRAVEAELARFAERYALYNKCIKAQEHLQEAITLVTKKIDEVRKNQTEQAHELGDKISGKRRKLIQDLETKSEKFKTDIGNKITSKHKELIKGFLSDSVIDVSVKKIMQGMPHQQHFMFKTKAEANEEAAKKAAAAEIKRSYEQWEQSFNSHDEHIFQGLLDKFIQEYIHLIKDNDDLTQEEKELLEKSVRFSVGKAKPAVHVPISAEQFLFWHTFDYSNVKGSFKLVCENDLTGYSQNYIKQYVIAVSKWLEDTINIITLHLAEFNPELRELSDDLKKLKDKLRELEDQAQKLTAAQAEIKNLLKFQNHSQEGETT